MVHLALYGNVKIPRTFCKSCERYCLVLDGKTACCDEPVLDVPKAYKRITEPESRRRTPNESQKKAILEQQDYRCLYCDRRFGDVVETRRGDRKINLVWDHKTPYAFTQNNHHANFAAACSICNGWKSDKIFRDVEEVKLYVNQKWQAYLASKKLPVLQ